MKAPPPEPCVAPPSHWGVGFLASSAENEFCCFKLPSLWYLVTGSPRTPAQQVVGQRPGGVP